jgi:hypothetical protein
MTTYQLVLQAPFSSINDYDRMIAVEELIADKFGGACQVDGHDTGASEMNIFIFTTSPRDLFARLLEVEGVRSFLSDGKAAYRGMKDDDEFIVLYPAAGGRFSVA